MAAKRQRTQLAGLKGVSDSALAAVIAALRADQDAFNDTGFSQPSISRALLATFRASSSLIELPRTEEEKKPFEWRVMLPQKTLQVYLDECPSFKRLFVETWAKRPATYLEPWHIVVFMDELTPGSLLAPEHSRKTAAFYWSFFGVRPQCIEIGRILASDRDAPHVRRQNCRWCNVELHAAAVEGGSPWQRRHCNSRCILEGNSCLRQ